MVFVCVYAETPRQAYEKATNLGKEQKYSEALPYLTKAISAKKCPIDVFYTAIEYAKKAKNYQQALQYANEALKNNGNNIDLLYAHAKIAITLKQSNVAIKDLQSIIALYPNNIFVLHHLSSLYMQLKQYALASEYYEKIFESSPQYFLEHLMQEANNLSLEELNTILFNNPKFYLACYQRMKIYAQSGPYKSAILDCQTLLNNGYITPEIYTYKAQSHAKLKEYEKAFRDYTVALELQETAERYVARSETAYNIASSKEKAYAPEQEYKVFFETAISDLTKAIALAPSDLYYNKRGIIYVQKRQYEQAIEDFTQAIAYNSQKAEYYYNRAIVKSKMKHLLDAIKDFSLAIKCDPTSVAIIKSRGNCYLVLQEYSNAYKDYARAYELDSKQTDLLERMSYALLYLQQWDKALETINQAININPKKDSYFYRRSEIYFSMENYALALESIEVARKLNPLDEKYYNFQIQLEEKLQEQNKAAEEFFLHE
jgi:tetratricopeptide (TPR) repeat protein